MIHKSRTHTTRYIVSSTDSLSGLEKDALGLHILDYWATSIFLTIKYVLAVLASLPVTAAIAEGSFSTLKRMKTY